MFLIACGSDASFYFSEPKRHYPVATGTPSTGRYIHGSGKIFRFSTEIAVYLKTGTR